MTIISKEQYADYTEKDKQNAARGLQREMISNKDNQAFIQRNIRKFIDAGHDPRALTAILCGRYEPFLPEIYRQEYPPVDQAVLEVAFRDSIIKHAREYRWDKNSVIAQYWDSRNKELGFPLYEHGSPLYVLVALELESLQLKDNEFSIVVATHGCASVFKAKIPRVGEVLETKNAELEPTVTDDAEQAALPDPEDEARKNAVLAQAQELWDKEICGKGSGLV